MFTMADLRLLLTFVVAVSLLAVGLAMLAARGLRLPARRLHRGSVLGGIIFGVGWAICGACPSIAWVQLGEGQLGALLVLAGLFMGNAACRWTTTRLLRWPSESCAEL